MLIFYILLSLGVLFAQNAHAIDLPLEDTCIELERPSLQRFVVALKKHEIAQANKVKAKHKVFWGTIGAGACLIGGGILAYNLKKNYWTYHGEPGVCISETGAGQGVADTSVAEKETKKEKSEYEKIFSKSMQMLVVGLISTSLLYAAGKTIEGSWGIAKNFCVKYFPWAKQKPAACLMPLAKRIDFSLDRVRLALRELSLHKKGDFFFSHYKLELRDSFALCINSLEKFCAVFLYELQKINSSDESVLESCRTMVERLFAYAGSAAEIIERDINSDEWSGVCDESIAVVLGLKKEATALINYFSVFKDGPEEEDE